MLCSFSTSEDTKAYLSTGHSDLIDEPDVELVQNKSPKVDAATMEPVSYPKDPEQEWCVACLTVSSTGPDQESGAMQMLPARGYSMA